MEHPSENSLPQRIGAVGVRAPLAARRPILAAMGLFVAVLLLYGFTAQHGIGWQDQGEYVLRMVRGDQVHEMGLALTHPLHQWFGRIAISLLPTEPPHAAALVSALFGAVTVAVVFACVVSLTRSTAAGLFAALSLALAHTFWRLGTYVDCYTISTSLLAIECACLIGFARTRAPGWLLGMMFANGLGLANHNLALLTLPVLGVVLLLALFRWRELTVGGFALAIGLWVVGSLPYTGLVLGRFIETGEFMATMHSALFGDRFQSSVLHAGLPLERTAISLGFTALSFPSLALVLGVVGMVAGRMPALVRWALLAGLAIHLLFVLRYDVIDQFTFLGPAYTLAMIFAGVGMARLLARPRSRGRRIAAGAAAALLIVTPLVYLPAPHLARNSGLVEPFERNRPYRDDYQYLFHPWRFNETSAADMSRRAVELAGERGMIISTNPMADYAIVYQLLRRGHDGVYLRRELSEQLAQFAVQHDRPVVLVPDDRDDPDDPRPPPWGRWERRGDLYIWKPEPADDD